jgi:hypothetical protein
MKTDNLISLLARDLDTPATAPRQHLLHWLPLAVVTAGGLFLAALGLRPDIASQTAIYPTSLKLGLGVLLALLAGFGAFRLVRPDAATSWSLLTTAPVAAAIILMLARDPSWISDPAPRWTSVLRCVTLIPVMALLPLAAFLNAMRAGAVARPEIAGALAGLASAGMAIMAYGLNCTEDSPLFVGVWYATAAVLTAAIGAIAARRALVW